MESLDEESSNLISERSEGGHRRGRRAKKRADGDAVVRHGLKGKTTHASKQVDEGEGYSVDVADEASFKHYVFVNADEYGLFDQPHRRFLQMVVCYQVLSTAWNSATKHEPSSLKPRFLFLFSDALFVMKMHDVTDTNTRRYRILGRINLMDLTVEEVGDDMFDLLARGMGAMRFSVGSSLTKTQTVAAFRKAIRYRQGRAGGRPTRAIPPTGAPSNPDDVYATMNFALSVLEKKMRGTATEEEQWQVDTLLAHALEMQERLHGALEPSSIPASALPSGGGAGGAGGVTSRGGGAAAWQAQLQAQLQAKEAQLRAMEERAAAAEAAVSRLRGSTAAVDASNAENRNLTLENRSLRLDVDRLRAQVEERDKQLAALREEVGALKKAARTGTATDLAYHEGSVDEVLSRIQRGPPAGAPVSASAATVSRDLEREREEADGRARERLQAEQRAAEEGRRQEEEKKQEERRREEDRKRRQKEEEEEEENRRMQDEQRAAEEADRKFRQLQEAKKKVDQQKASNIDSSLDQFLSAAPAKKATKKSSSEDESSSAKQQPATAVARPKAEVVAAAAKAAARGAGGGGGGGGTEESSEALSTDGEGGSFSTSASESEAGDDLRAFLVEHDLGHLRKQLEDRVTLPELKAMDLASVRGLGLSYADSSNLATALGIKVVH